MSAPPYMKLWIADYLADTTHLTRSEHGAYLLLLMALWRAGGRLPRDPAKLARIAKATPAEWDEIGPVVLEFFKVSGGSISQKRATAEIAKYQGVVKGSKTGGKASAAKRASKNNGEEATDVGRTVEPFSNQPEPEPEPEKEKVRALFPEPAAAEAPAESGKAAAPKGSRLKPEWKPSADNIAYAVAQGFTTAQVDRIVEDFCDYWHAKAGKDALKTDWSLTWRSWVRKTDRRIVARTTAAKRVGFV